MVETVRGSIDADALGTTLMHEHVFVVDPEYASNYGRTWWDEDERVADAAARLRELRSRGVSTIVDPTVLGLGRDIDRVKRVNAEVDINIVVATGLYTYDDVPFYLRYRRPREGSGDPDVMTGMFVGDIREGIGDTGVRAAFLKCCVESPGLTPGVDRVLRAVAAAHRETGAPVTVHTNARARSGTPALQVLGEEGVDLTRVVIGHSGDTNDLDYLRSIMDTGAIAGMDRFGVDAFNPTASRVATVATLAAEGYADRMVLSHDASCFIDYYPTSADRTMLRQAAPNWHFTHIHDDVLPALRARGVDDRTITTMLVDNPRRYFSPAA